jgi:hypothetical protein
MIRTTFDSILIYSQDKIHSKSYTTDARMPLYHVSASYEQDLDSSTFQHACYHKYAKRLRLEKTLMGHCETHNILLTLSIP